MDTIQQIYTAIEARTMVQAAVQGTASAATTIPLSLPSTRPYGILEL